MTHAPEDRDPVERPEDSEESQDTPTRSRSSASEGAEASGAAHRSGRSKRAPLPLWQETALLLGVALVLAVAIKSLLLQAFYIPSGSMNDTLVLDDRILVQKVSYWGDGEPERGDIVVFSDPGGWLQGPAGTASNPATRALELFGLYPTGGHLVKRVIGVGGDRVTCCADDGRIMVNGVPLNERAYLAAGEKPSMIEFDIEVQDGYLWVQGDNRSNSADSRVHLGDPGGGQVPVEDVVGKVFAVAWPWRNVTLLDRPATFDGVG